MKKYIALILCLLMVVSCFVGCGKKEEEPVDLVVWTAYEEGTPTYDVANEMIAKFEEERGVNLEVVHYGRDLGTILGTALEAGERVDVFPLGSQQQLAANVEYTMDLTDYINGSDMLDRAYPIHMKTIMEYGGNEGRYHAIPTVSSFNSFWYNKAAFEEAGITKNPETIEEFEAACDALVAAGYAPMSLDAAYAVSTFAPLVERYCGDVTNMMYEGGFETNEGFVKACQKIIDWKAAGYYDPNAPGEWPASQNKIGLTGETVMVYTGMWLPSEVEEMTGAQLEWGCFKFPYEPEGPGTYSTTCSCTCNCINVNSENPDLAWEYIYYMSTGEVNKAITDADGYVVDDRTMEPLPTFIEGKELLETTTDVMEYSAGLHGNADIKTSVNDLVVNLYSGVYATGEEAAAAFENLVNG